MKFITSSLLNVIVLLTTLESMVPALNAQETLLSIQDFNLAFVLKVIESLLLATV